MAADGTDLRQLVDGGRDQAWIPSWSPDGTWIAYTLSPVDTTGAFAGAPEPNAAPGALRPPSAGGGTDVWVVHADGSAAHQLTTGDGDNLAAAWSPDGKSIAYLSALGGGNTDLYVADVTDGAIGTAKAIAADPANDWGISWSPKGDLLAFTSNRTGNEEIWTVRPDGSGLIRITDSLAGDWVPAWSPDGSRIAFVSDREGDVEVWSMASDGSDVRNLTNSPSTGDGQWSVTWSPDGKRLLYASAPYPPPGDSGWVREDLTAAITLLFALTLAIVALVIVGLGAPFGAFTAAMGIMVALAALPTDEWRFLPAGLLAGWIVDGLLRFGRYRNRAVVAASALPALGVLGIGVTLAVEGTLAWSNTLLLGVTVAVALLGWGVAAIVGSLTARSTRTPAGGVGAAD
jgi:Tol biopolymer transport system component